jgi:hypothetical protein
MRYRYRHLIAGVLFVIVPEAAAAQSIEAAFTIGHGQRGSEGALVRTEARLVSGIQVGLRGDRLETAARVAWLDLPSIRSGGTYYYGCRIGPDGRCLPTGSFEIITRGTSPRLFVSGQVLYHFRRGQGWRPFAGLGFGSMRDSEETTCERADCVRLIPGLHAVLGRRIVWHADPFIPVVGIGTRVGEHLAIRAGVQFHRPLDGGLSLFETFASVGYRF